MAIHLKCPACNHLNHFALDDLMGKYGACNNCSSLVKIVDEDEETQSGCEKEKRHDR